MKKIIMFSILAVLAINGFCQQVRTIYWQDFFRQAIIMRILIEVSEDGLVKKIEHSYSELESIVFNYNDTANIDYVYNIDNLEWIPLGCNRVERTNGGFRILRDRNGEEEEYASIVPTKDGYWKFEVPSLNDVGFIEYKGDKLIISKDQEFSDISFTINYSPTQIVAMSPFSDKVWTYQQQSDLLNKYSYSHQDRITESEILHFEGGISIYVLSNSKEQIWNTRFFIADSNTHWDEINLFNYILTIGGLWDRFPILPFFLGY